MSGGYAAAPRHGEACPRRRAARDDARRSRTHEVRELRDEAQAGGRAGDPGGARRARAARAAERREWAQCGGVIPTCAGRAVGVGPAAGVGAETYPKEAEQEE